MISKWAAKVGLAAVMLGAVTAAGAGPAPNWVRAFGSVYLTDGAGGQYVCSAYGMYEHSVGSIYLAVYSGRQQVLFVSQRGVIPSWWGSSVVFDASGTWNGSSSVPVTITFTPNPNNIVQGSISIVVHGNNGNITLNRLGNLGFMFVGAS